MKYKPITNTYVFKQFQNNITNVIQDTITKSDILSETELQEQLVLINKYIKSGLKLKVIKEFEENKIRLLYANDGIPKMTSLPFIMTVSGSDINANVIVSTFGSRRQDGIVNIEYRKLYSLMESAYIAKKVLINCVNLLIFTLFKSFNSDTFIVFLKSTFISLINVESVVITPHSK